MAVFLTKEELNEPIILDDFYGLKTLRCLDCEGIFYAPVARPFCSCWGHCSNIARQEENLENIQI